MDQGNGYGDEAKAHTLDASSTLTSSMAKQGLKSVARGAPLLPHCRGPSLFTHVDANPHP